MIDGLLLIHAFPMDASMWEPQRDALAGTTAVVAPNLPGFGGAPGAGDVMSMGLAAAAWSGELEILHGTVSPPVMRDRPR